MVPENHRLFVAYYAAGVGDRSVGGFAALTMLTKKFPLFRREVRKQYVVTARAKGVSEKHLLETCFRNAMLLVIAAGFPPLLSVCFHRLAATGSHVLAQRPQGCCL